MMAPSKWSYYDTIHYKHHMQPFYLFPLKYYMSCDKWKIPDLYSAMVSDLKIFLFFRRAYFSDSARSLFWTYTGLHFASFCLKSEMWVCRKASELGNKGVKFWFLNYFRCLYVGIPKNQHLFSISEFLSLSESAMCSCSVFCFALPFG